jgi:hypothetical protein
VVVGARHDEGRSRVPAPQLLAGLQDVRAEDADEVDGDDHHPLPAVSDGHRARPQVVVDCGGLPVVVEPGHVRGLRSEDRRDRPSREPEPEAGLRRRRREHGEHQQKW